MEPKPGDKVGPYELVSAIGKGGMGEVWKARDTRLTREVAIKFSQAQFSDRFQREANAIASLNHPNICTLFDVGPNYLVMELIEGPTVAERIKEGPIPLEEALTIAKQIADALEAAHEKNIVHRDLKPGNVKIRPDGSVKVLDFGLAKAGETQEVTPDSPTMMPGTQMGMILGTAGYMSPEQARGKEVDKRADIWAFGVVLYEIVTGKRLFEGETVSDSLAAVLTREADLRLVPEKTRLLLQRCLEKDRKRRLRDIGDAMPLLGVGQTFSLPERANGPLRKGLIAAVAVMTVLLAALAFVHFREKTPIAETGRFEIPPPGKTSFDGSDAATLPPALSPDGRRLVFGAGGKLWLRSLDMLAAQPLPGTENGYRPFWSPDSRSVGFFTDDRKLKRIDISGGPALTLADAFQGEGGAWSSSGMIVFAPSYLGGLRKIPASGGTAVALTKPEPGKETLHANPWFLPDGKHFLFTGSAAGGRATVRIGSMDSSETRTLMVADSNAVFAQGYVLSLRGTTLMAQSFDPKRLALFGEAVPVAEQVEREGLVGSFSVSERGTLAYAAGNRGRQLTWFDRSGRRTGSIGAAVDFGAVNLSPDGRTLAASVVESSNPVIWLYDVARGLRSRFTFDPANEFEAIWSPDRATIVFNSTRRSHYDLYRKPSNGANAEELLYGDGLEKFPTSWSPDGKALLYFSLGDTKTGNDLWILPNPLGVPGASKPWPLVQTRFNEAFGRFSPDGKWIAFQSDESGRWEIYAIPFPGPGAKRQISTAGGVFPRWRADGKEIFYLWDNLMSAKVRETASTLDVEEVKTLFPLMAGEDQYDVSGDGQRILALVPAEQGARQLLTVVLNWTAALKNCTNSPCR